MLDPYPTALARFRPTPVQAASWGAGRGGLLGAGVAGVLAVSVAAGSGSGWAVLAAAVVPLLAGLTLGAVAGLVRGRRVGVEADDAGLRRLSTARRVVTGWDGIDDIRAERRGSRTVIAVHLGSGAVARLGAPYDGRWLAADPGFESKLFTLRNLWETHRSWGTR